MISALIVNYRTPQLLRRCLNSLSGWDEVVVVDNCSGDDSAAMVGAEFNWARLVEADENRGFGAGANLGMVHTTGEVVLLLNPDTWVGPATSPAIHAFFDSHPDAGILGCGLYDPDGLPLISARRFYAPSTVALRRLAPASKTVQDFELLDHTFTHPERVDWVAGSGMAVRRDAFETVGGFDEKFFLYFEDVDLCLRMWLAGFEVWHDRNAPVFHVESRASARSVRPLLWHLGSWRRFERKWAGLGLTSFGQPPEAAETRPKPSDYAVDTTGLTPLRPKRSHEGAIRVGIEASVLLDAPTGVGRSLEGLVKAFAERDDIDPTLIAVSFRKTGRVHRYRTLANTRAVRLPARPMQNLWAHSKLPPAEWLTGKIDVFHGPNYFVPPTASAASVVTVHDIGFVRHPEFHTPTQRALAESLPQSLKRARRIITVSEFTRDEVAEWAGISTDLIDVVPHGVRKLPTEGPRPEGLPDEYLLYAGTLESRKGAEILLGAYSLAVRASSDLPPLVIAGAEGLGASEAIAGSGLDDGKLIRLGRVDDSELAKIYEGASAFVFPSIYEGFGMPPLEAMAEGTPVIATATSSLPEVLGDAALLTEASADSVAEGILRVMGDSALRNDLSSRGVKRASTFTWQRSAELAIESYRKAMET
ncbi:MAG: hypothetical protein DCC49_09710 [Acidobacteria bacterium]|nr:MAG: hypothetical protein DCC49_09710 [Acidobacteriota bacterium]